MALNKTTENMNVSLPPISISREPEASGYSEIINISLDNKASKKYVCDLCDFRGNDKGGMKRHIRTKHKA